MAPPDNLQGLQHLFYDAIEPSHCSYCLFFVCHFFKIYFFSFNVFSGAVYVVSLKRQVLSF
jgi:hypothetical protein